MEAWSTCALSDFLMFSPGSYYRRYELANAALWPGQLLLLGVASWLWWSSHRPSSRPALFVMPLLAAVWAFVAYWFLYREYAQINLAAGWFALVFLLQALLLVLFGIAGHRRDFHVTGPVSRWHPGSLLFVYAVLIHPLVGLATGRHWQGVELFGVAPDATALATLGLLLTGYRAARWPLLVIPLAWCVVSALTYLAMGDLQGTAPLGVGIAAGVAAVAVHRRHRAGARSRSVRSCAEIERSHPGRHR